ncbi:hypothetical protein ARTHRO_11617 [Limnospira indica PCC 8005]|uniref:Uncharacterized protein n=1 Tax=Limnospira indica PCC 8005 TaxID=376219 RepID=A0A9P1KD83_9CYAN|nr:hypothetical protein ARTHRO_11617 [Limnospira indica PCC 8005]
MADNSQEVGRFNGWCGIFDSTKNPHQSAWEKTQLLEPNTASERDTT